MLDKEEQRVYLGTHEQAVIRKANRDSWDARRRNESPSYHPSYRCFD